EMVVTSLATGFAAAVQPVMAQTMITTDTEGLEAGETKSRVEDGEIPAYQAMPAEGGPFPVVLVGQEILGVHEHIKDICRRLPKAVRRARRRSGWRMVISPRVKPCRPRVDRFRSCSSCKRSSVCTCT